MLYALRKLPRLAAGNPAAGLFLL